MRYGILAIGFLGLSACVADGSEAPAIKPGKGLSAPSAPNRWAELPQPLQELARQIQDGPVSNPPDQFLRHRIEGRSYYYRPARCCDFYSELYDAAGRLVCHPDGGLTGRGDGRCPGLMERAGPGELLWRDKRDRRMEGGKPRPQ